MSFVDVVWQPSGGQESEQSLKIRHVKFESCTFKRNKFVNVQTPNTRFESCNFEQTVFYDTDLKSTDDQKFQERFIHFDIFKISLKNSENFLKFLFFGNLGK